MHLKEISHKKIYRKNVVDLACCWAVSSHFLRYISTLFVILNSTVDAQEGKLQERKKLFNLKR